jgi:hypothetical protein
LDIGRGERLAVVPGAILAQVENKGLAVVLLFPAGGQAWRGLEVGVVFEQRIEDVVRNRRGGSGYRHASHKALWFGANVGDQRGPAPSPLCAPSARAAADDARKPRRSMPFGDSVMRLT